MLGCQQCSGEHRDGQGSCCRKSEVRGDLVRVCTAGKDLRHEDGEVVPDSFRNAQTTKADD